MVEKVLQRRPKEIDDQDVVETLLAKVVDIRNAGCSRCQLDGFGWVRGARGLTASDKDLVGTVLISQLRSITLSGFLGLWSAECISANGVGRHYKFYGNLLIVQKVGTLKDDTE